MPTTRPWFKICQQEHGLSTRKPARKCNVPKAVHEQRLDAGWLKVLSVGAFCFEVYSYDPDIEHWD